MNETGQSDVLPRVIQIHDQLYRSHIHSGRMKEEQYIETMAKIIVPSQGCHAGWAVHPARTITTQQSFISS
jgi:hypothetical protein